VAPGQGHNYWPGFFRCQELIDFVINCAKADGEDVFRERVTRDAPDIGTMLTPCPQRITLGEGYFSITNSPWMVALPGGPDHEACRGVVTAAMQQAGATLNEGASEGNSFVIGQRVELPELPREGHAEEAYVLRIAPTGVTALGASPAGTLHAARPCGSCCVSAPNRAGSPADDR